MENGPIDPAIFHDAKNSLAFLRTRLGPILRYEDEITRLGGIDNAVRESEARLVQINGSIEAVEARAAEIIASAERRAADIDGAAEERGKAAATAAAAAETARLQEAHAEADRELAAKAQRLAELGAEEKRVANEIAALKKRLG